MTQLGDAGGLAVSMKLSAVASALFQ